jgi:O-antigen/teichoic acid export membrane protein
MTGATIAQAIPVALSPILTRIYTPEDFGVFALFIAITSIFGTIANGRYELAIVLPKKDEDAINIFALGFIITTLISLILFILVVIFNDYFAQLFNNEEIAIWLYVVPVSVFFTGIFNILNYFNNRKKQYKDLAKAMIIKSIVAAITQISVGLVKNGATGLISGQVISQFFANTRLLLSIIKDKALVSKISKIKMIAMAKRYKSFPKYSMWAGLSNALTHNLTSILISTFYSITTLGVYGLVQKVLGAPLTLIGGSIGQVFYQQAAKEKQKTGKSIKAYNSTLKKLISIGLPFFGVLFFVIEDLFAFVYGEEWRMGGVYAQILIPLYLIRFVVSPISAINPVYLKNKLGLYWQVGLLALQVIILYAANLYSIDFVYVLYLISGVTGIYYVFYLYLINLYLRKGED